MKTSMKISMYNRTKIININDLEVWKEAHQLVLEIYNNTKKFSSLEIYGLVSQMKRASLSISSNIAEGFSRRTRQDIIHFYSMARGSLTELHNQLLVSKDLNYINSNEYDLFMKRLDKIYRLITGLQKSAFSRMI
jgi:four helix bundle protein